jgi:uncharacterized protein
VLLRAVADTNLFVSLALGAGATLQRFVDYWEDERFVLLISPQTLDELRWVLGRAWRQTRLTPDPAALLELVEHRCERTPGGSVAPGVCRDPDDKFLSCAVEGQADYLVTGDRDLLALQEFRGVRIVTPSQFVQLLDEPPTA